MFSFSTLGHTNLSGGGDVSSYRVSSEWWNKELCMKWIESVKQTGNLPSDGGGFFISYSHFHGSCFERGLKIIIPLLKH